MILYIIIFISKVIENAIATLRIIVVSNGKKLLGAILQGVVAIIWICVTGIVVVDILKDPIKIVAFSLGTAVGSYLGSLLEEKIALGINKLTIIINEDNEKIVSTELEKIELIFTTTSCKNKKSMIVVLLPRKKINTTIKKIQSMDSNALIISESVFNTYGKF